MVQMLRSETTAPGQLAQLRRATTGEVLTYRLHFPRANSPTRQRHSNHQQSHLKTNRCFAPIAPNGKALQNHTPRRQGCDLSSQTVLSFSCAGKEIANNQLCNGLISAPGDSEPPSLI